MGVVGTSLTTIPAAAVTVFTRLEGALLIRRDVVIVDLTSGTFAVIRELCTLLGNCNLAE